MDQSSQDKINVEVFCLEDDVDKRAEVAFWIRGNFGGFSDIGARFNLNELNSVAYLAQMKDMLAAWHPDLANPTYLIIDGNIQIDAKSPISPHDPEHGNGLTLARDWLTTYVGSLMVDGEIPDDLRAQLQNNLRLVIYTRDTDLFTETNSDGSISLYQQLINQCDRYGVEIQTAKHERPSLLGSEVGAYVQTDLRKRLDVKSIEGQQGLGLEH